MGTASESSGSRIIKRSVGSAGWYSLGTTRRVRIYEEATTKYTKNTKSAAIRILDASIIENLFFGFNATRDETA
jgi:hypothetical protein